VRRAVVTGSWLGRAHQGLGIGKEMRAAVLHLAFAGLGAEWAESAAFLDNPASIAVSRAVGYEDDGMLMKSRRGEPAVQQRFLMTRARWLKRRPDGITIDGLDRCRSMFGV
jgi:RimJ/RimL family protein N-acetyltransferase